MSEDASISVGWPVPTNLKFSKEKSGVAGHKAIFSWDKIEETDPSLLVDASGGGFYARWWRVMINENKTYLVYNAPTFEIGIPSGCCEMCVKVQTIYDLSSVTYEFGSLSDLATSDWCGKVCVPCDPDRYCESVNGETPTVKTQNAMSSKMRYSLALRNVNASSSYSGSYMGCYSGEGGKFLL
jgi:hypothetical protein